LINLELSIKIIFIFFLQPVKATTAITYSIDNTTSAFVSGGHSSLYYYYNISFMFYDSFHDVNEYPTTYHTDTTTQYGFKLNFSNISSNPNYIEVLVPSNLNVVLWGVQNVATGGWGNTATNVWKRPTTELGSGSWVFPNDILWSTGVVSRFSLHQQNVCDWTLTFCRYTSYFPSPTMPQAASGLESPPWIGDNYTYGNGMYYFDISIRTPHSGTYQIDWTVDNTIGTYTGTSLSFDNGYAGEYIPQPLANTYAVLNPNTSYPNYTVWNTTDVTFYYNAGTQVSWGWGTPLAFATVRLWDNSTEEYDPWEYVLYSHWNVPLDTPQNINLALNLAGDNGYNINFTDKKLMLTGYIVNDLYYNSYGTILDSDYVYLNGSTNFTPVPNGTPIPIPSPQPTIAPTGTPYPSPSPFNEGNLDNLSQGNNTFNGSGNMSYPGNLSGFSELGNDTLIDIHNISSNISGSIVSYNYTKSKSVYSYFLPAIFNMIPAKLWGLIILGFALEISLILWKR